MRHAKDSQNEPRARRRHRPRTTKDTDLARRGSRARRAYRRPDARRELEEALAEAEAIYLGTDA